MLADKWSLEKLKFIKENYLDKSRSELALYLNTNTTTVYHLLIELKLIKRKSLIPKGYSEYQYEWLKRNFSTASWEEINKVIPNKSRHTITELARRYGLGSRDRKYFSARKGDVNILLSDNLEIFYWIGFLLADGYFHQKTQMVLVSDIRDLQHLKKFADLFGIEPKIYKQGKSGYSSNGTQVRVSIADKNIIPLVCNKFDFKDKKTYNPPDIKVLDAILDTKEKFIAYFCGFVDGDGAIFFSNVKYKLSSGNIKTYSNTKLSIENNISYRDLLLFFLSRLSIYYGINVKSIGENDKKNTCKITIGDKKFLIRLKVDLYELNLPLLERKWSKIK